MIRVINSIAKELMKGYPTHEIYRQKVPKNFNRPSFYIKYIVGDVEEMNLYNRKDNMSFQITYFEQLDDNNFVIIDKQLEEVEKLKSIFNKGYFEVEGTGGRKAKITSLNISTQDDEIVLKIEIYISNFEPIKTDDDSYELIKEINTRI